MENQTDQNNDYPPHFSPLELPQLHAKEVHVSEERLVPQESEVEGPNTNLGLVLEEIFDTLPTKEDIQKPHMSVAVRLTDAITALETQMQMYKKWFDAEKRKYEQKRAFIESILENFMRNNYAETKIKTLSLPNSYKLNLKKAREGIEIVDEETAIKWAEENMPDILKIETKLSKTKIMEHLKNTGELPPGVEVKTPDNELSFSITEPK